MSNEKPDTCVKFSRNSWHRKLHDIVYGKHELQQLDNELKLDEDNNAYRDYFWVDKQINLCPYMRRIVWACVLFPFLLVWRHLPTNWKYHKTEARAIVVFAILCTIAHVLLAYGAGIWYAGLIGFFGGMGIAFGVWGLMILCEKIEWKLTEKRFKEIKEGKIKKTKNKKFINIGLISAYLHAKHEKICPCIEFVDVEKKEVG